MMSTAEELMITYRPDGKKGIAMTRRQYDILSLFILTLLETDDDQTLQTILDRAQNELIDAIDSDVAWFVLQVKLDLEARDFIRTVQAPYNRRVCLLSITRAGQRKLRADRSLADLSR